MSIICFIKSLISILFTAVLLICDCTNSIICSHRTFSASFSSYKFVAYTSMHRYEVFFIIPSFSLKVAPYSIF
jgi:hypothetical protein